MIHAEPKDLPIPQIHGYLLGGVQPRPIALVSTVSKEGVNNLSPFSFYNAFGANPPTVAFSASRRGSDATFKDTYNNLIEMKECVVQAVTHAIIEQINLTSAKFAADVDEFKISGLTPIDSDIVAPKRVEESPFQMECKLQQMIPLGDGRGSGDLAICEVVKFHIADDIFRGDIIYPDFIDLVGRNGGAFYTRASGDAVFELIKPDKGNFIGFERLPAFMKESHVYSGNNLGRFALTEKFPTDEEATGFIESFRQPKDKKESKQEFYRALRRQDYESMLRTALALGDQGHLNIKTLLERTAKCALENGNTECAWNTAVFAGSL